MTRGGQLLLSTLVLTALPIVARAQELAVTNEIMLDLATLHDVYREYIMETAAVVPEQLYSYQPTEDVRTLGAILAHVADNNYYFCAGAAIEPDPHAEMYIRTRTRKVDIITALEESFSYCATVYARTSDVDGTEKTSFQGAEYTVASILAANTAHNAAHYGNLVTYMRINGIVPPSTAGH